MNFCTKLNPLNSSTQLKPQMVTRWWSLSKSEHKRSLQSLGYITCRAKCVNIRYANHFQLILADCQYRFMHTFFSTKLHQVSPVVPLTNYYAFPHLDGPLADTDTQCFAKSTHTRWEIRKLHSQWFTSHALN